MYSKHGFFFSIVVGPDSPQGRQVDQVDLDALQLHSIKAIACLPVHECKLISVI